MQKTPPSPPGLTSGPIPADGATVAAVAPAALSWHAAPGATSYEVWLDGKKVASVPATAAAVQQWTPPRPLAAGPHQWHATALNAHGRTTGQTWRFTIAAAPPPPPPTPTPAPAPAPAIDLPIGPGAKIICVSPGGADANDGRRFGQCGRSPAHARAIDPSRQNVILLEAGGLWPERSPRSPAAPAPTARRSSRCSAPGPPAAADAGQYGELAGERVANLFFADLDLARRPRTPTGCGSCRAATSRSSAAGCAASASTAPSRAWPRRGARGSSSPATSSATALGHAGDDASGLFVSGTDGVLIDRQRLRPQRLGRRLARHDAEPQPLRHRRLHRRWPSRATSPPAPAATACRPAAGGLVAENLFLDNAIGLSYGLVEGTARSPPAASRARSPTTRSSAGATSDPEARHGPAARQHAGRRRQSATSSSTSCTPAPTPRSAWRRAARACTPAETIGVHGLTPRQQPDPQLADPASRSRRAWSSAARGPSPATRSRRSFDRLPAGGPRSTTTPARSG
jgi:hypothetical protein